MGLGCWIKPCLPDACHAHPDLHRYCNEFSFRWNYRKDDDATRTIAAIRVSDGKRLMYQDPIMKMVRDDDPSAPF